MMHTRRILASLICLLFAACVFPETILAKEPISEDNPSGLRAAPTELAAPEVYISHVNAEGKPFFSWNPVDGASEYVIYRSVGNDSSFSWYYKTPYWSFNNISATAGTTYYYKVCALDANGTKGPFSDIVSITATEGLAAPVITVTRHNDDGTPHIEWNEVEHAEQYVIFRAVGDGEFSKYYTTTYKSFNNYSAVAGNTYHYKIYILDEFGNKGPFSDIVSITARYGAPTLESKGTNNGKPTIEWKCYPRPSSYSIYRSTSQDGTFSQYANCTKATFTDSSAQAGVTYYYKVCAVEADGGEGPFSNTVSIRAVSNAVSAPQNMRKGVTSLGKPYITWNPVYDPSVASKYAIYRSVGDSSSFSKYYTTTYISFTNTSAEAGTTYYYKVCALDANGDEGPFGEMVSVTATQGLTAPEMTVATANVNGKPHLEWAYVEGAEKYTIYRSVGNSSSFSKYYTTEFAIFNNTSAETGTTYYYKVCAVGADNKEGPLSEPVSVTATEALTAPTIVSSGVNANGKPFIQWSAVERASRYVVYRLNMQEDPFYNYYYDTRKAEPTSFTNISAAANATYSYKIVAVDSIGYEGPSSEAVTITATTALTAPVIVSATTNSNGKPQLKWNAVEGAEKYVIYRATSQNGTYSKYYTTTYKSFNNTSAQAGTTYYYKVCAVTNAGFEGPLSEARGITAK